MKRLILRGVDFGSVLVASGTLNFFGEGWPYHRIYSMLFRGFDFSGATFVAKTTTLNARAGNMPLNENLQPKELFPRCIKVSFRKQTVLNSVGLSGPGADALLDSMKWQQRTKPFFISFMAVGKTKEDRLEETRIFAAKLNRHLGNFSARIGLQINISCPNADHDPEELAHEAVNYLEIVFPLGIPIDLKINALTPIKAARMIVATGLLDSLTVSNTIPFGKLPEFINWKKLFGTSLSPLAEFGGGGLSGAPLLPIVGNWVENARSAGINSPIVAGGGILKPSDVDYLSGCGATAIAIGSASILKPWNVKRIIKRANKITNKRR